jgi:hypothetical protein
MIYPDGKKRISPNIEGIFENMLLYYEGKSYAYHGSSYGRVEVSYEEPVDRESE